MISYPEFQSKQDFVARLDDVGFWQPYIEDILRRYDQESDSGKLVAGIGGTYPTFICGDFVVKLFGYTEMWAESFAAESAAHAVLAADREIAAPRLLAEGRLYMGAAAPWPYLVTTRMPGVFWDDNGLSAEQKHSIAADLGRQIGRVHALCPDSAATHESWSARDITAAAEQSSLPPHLTAQIDDYLTRLRLSDNVFVHGDLMYRHVFTADGRLSGLIDWGDAMLTDRHYELAKLHLDLFDCDKSLLRTFLDASNWPVGPDFARKAMGLALHRQAHGLSQHHTMDVFYKLPALFPLQDVCTLDELATELFTI